MTLEKFSIFGLQLSCIIPSELLNKIVYFSKNVFLVNAVSYIILIQYNFVNLQFHPNKSNPPRKPYNAFGALGIIFPRPTWRKPRLLSAREHLEHREMESTGWEASSPRLEISLSSPFTPDDGEPSISALDIFFGCPGASGAAQGHLLYRFYLEFI